MRTALLLLVIAGCVPIEDRCLFLSEPRLTEGEAARRVEAGAIFASVGTECGADACVRDGSVPPGEDLERPAAGYCALRCEAVCPRGTRCTEVNQIPLCLHAP